MARRSLTHLDRRSGHRTNERPLFESIARCGASVHHRTGVEMEAPSGAAVAALMIDDMCKALSHEIEIVSVRLQSRSGGRRDFARATHGTER